MRKVRLPDGREVAQLGQGTWMIGENRRTTRDEETALALGIDLGLSLIDTAEMYGDGKSEELIGRVIKGRRNDVFLVSKVYPHNASTKGVPAACDRSLRRLGVEKIDLYLLHWRGGTPLAETVAALESLRAAGKIGAWGVSNFDAGDMAELASVPNGQKCATNQVLYHPQNRGIEFDLIADAARNGTTIMAYSPFGHSGAPLRSPALAAVAQRHAATPAQIALAWAMRHPHVMVIPKAGNPAHVRENAAAAAIDLSADDLAAIDAAHPPPQRKQSLAML